MGEVEFTLIASEFIFSRFTLSSVVADTKCAPKIDSIIEQISMDKPVVVIGETMGRVNPVADYLDD